MKKIMPREGGRLVSRRRISSQILFSKSSSERKSDSNVGIRQIKSVTGYQ